MKIIAALVGLAAMLLVGFNQSNDVHIISASRASLTLADKSNIYALAAGEAPRKWEKFELSMRRESLIRLMESESTLYVGIGDCGTRSNSFPSVAFFDNVALDEQHREALQALSNQPEVIAIKGYAPDNFVQKLPSICINLEGGSYLAPVRSNLVAVP